VLALASSAICTAGHMFISEMMFLNKPIYTIPLQTYEQKYNAKIIEDNGFGIARPKLDLSSLRDFLADITKFRHNIMSNKNILLNKEAGQAQIINLIEKMLKS
jgi:UDP-N-acetylglucosamine:LPS N-acetylglucosamine transferase